MCIRDRLGFETRQNSREGTKRCVEVEVDVLMQRTDDTFPFSTISRFHEPMILLFIHAYCLLMYFSHVHSCFSCANAYMIFRM